MNLTITQDSVMTSLDGLPVTVILISSSPSAFPGDLTAFGNTFTAWLEILPTSYLGLPVGSWWNNGGIPTMVMS